jgi:hypothetical protein
MASLHAMEKDAGLRDGLLKWHRRLMAKKWDFSARRAKSVGRLQGHVYLAGSSMAGDLPTTTNAFHTIRWAMRR